MYTEISEPIIYIFDVDSNRLIGTSKFNIPPKTEQDILQLVNYNKAPSSLFFTNADFYPVQDNYVPEIVGRTVTRRGILRALYENSESKISDPIDIQFRFDSRAFGHALERTHYSSSSRYH